MQTDFFLMCVFVWAIVSLKHWHTSAVNLFAFILFIKKKQSKRNKEIGKTEREREGGGGGGSAWVSRPSQSKCKGVNNSVEVKCVLKATSWTQEGTLARAITQVHPICSLGNKWLYSEVTLWYIIIEPVRVEVGVWAEGEPGFFTRMSSERLFAERREVGVTAKKNSFPTYFVPPPPPPPSLPCLLQTPQRYRHYTETICISSCVSRSFAGAHVSATSRKGKLRLEIRTSTQTRHRAGVNLVF